jgi:hypothetical protein
MKGTGPGAGCLPVSHHSPDCPGLATPQSGVTNCDKNILRHAILANSQMQDCLRDFGSGSGGCVMDDWPGKGRGCCKTVRGW